MKTAAYAVLGVIASIIFGTAFIPARAGAMILERIDGLILNEVSGTLWDGQATAVYRGHETGRLDWGIDPWALFGAEIRFDWRLSRGDHRLAGWAARGIGWSRLSATGSLGAAAVNPILASYHIQIAGDFEIHRLAARLDLATNSLATSGKLRWTGGQTIYRLSGRTYDVELPAMTARLDTARGEPQLHAVSALSKAPLIEARLDREGWLHIGITRRFTVLAGRPWPGAGLDDAVVLTVSEQMLNDAR